jgi:hypothetical protein
MAGAWLLHRDLSDDFLRTDARSAAFLDDVERQLLESAHNVVTILKVSKMLDDMFRVNQHVFVEEARARSLQRAVLAALRAQSASPAAQAACCRMLFMVQHLSHGAAAVDAPEACQAVTAAMRAHPADLQLQTFACIALVLLTRSLHGAHRYQRGERDIIKAVVAALRTHSMDASLHDCGLSVISSLVEDDTLNCDTARAAGAVQATVAALRTHTTDARVPVLARKVLLLLGKGDMCHPDAPSRPPGATVAAATADADAHGGSDTSADAMRATEAAHLFCSYLRRGVWGA